MKEQTKDQKEEQAEADRTASVYDVIFYESLGVGPVVPVPALPKLHRAEDTKQPVQTKE